MQIYLNKVLLVDGVKMTFDIDDYRKYLPRLMQSRFWESVSECDMYGGSNSMINTIIRCKHDWHLI